MDEFDFESEPAAGSEPPADEDVLFDEFPAEEAPAEPEADSEIEFAAAVSEEPLGDEPVIDPTDDAEPHTEQIPEDELFAAAEIASDGPIARDPNTESEGGAA